MRGYDASMYIRVYVIYVCTTAPPLIYTSTVCNGQVHVSGMCFSLSYQEMALAQYSSSIRTAGLLRQAPSTGSLGTQFAKTHVNVVA